MILYLMITWNITALGIILLEVEILFTYSWYCDCSY